MLPLYRVIGVANAKGGVGKSTTAIALIRALIAAGEKPVLIDGDALNVSSNWAGKLDFPFEVSSEPDELFDQVLRLKRSYDRVIIDSPGTLETMTMAVFHESDLVFIPVKPTGADFTATRKTFRQLRTAKRNRMGPPEVRIFLSMAGVTSNDALHGLEALRLVPEVRDLSLPVMQQVIYQRTCIGRSANKDYTVWDMKEASAQRAVTDYLHLFGEAGCVETSLATN